MAAPDLLPLVYYPDARLRTRAAEVDFNTPTPGHVERLAGRLVAAMVHYDGWAIAAPQVGVPLRMIAISDEAAGGPRHVVLVNPNLLWTAEGAKTAKEGCLSFPGVQVFVPRPIAVRVGAYSPQGEYMEFDAVDLFARALCHELDHLDAKLLIDYAPKIRQSTIRNRLRKYLSKVEEVAW